MTILPALPGHTLELLVDERPPEAERGFVYVRKLTLQARFADGTVSEPFHYFCADRVRMDAVVIVAHHRDAAGERHVFLRSALRPPVASRPLEVRPIPEPAHLGELWEVPAGLVEEDERTPEGLVSCARRELYEETGLDVPISALRPLGPSAFPAPGMIGERHFYFHVEVDPTTRTEPPEDGSALERKARVVSVPLARALEACRRGEVEDGKTELALRRLAEL
jgi:ADP-ribose pyrophosphatase